MKNPLLNERYEIGTLLGEGGMGVVHRAYDRQLKREVAIKFLRHGLRETMGYELFKNEFRILAQINHPYIARVYDLDRTDSKIFIVAELIDGQEFIAATAGMQIVQLAPLIAQICRALGYLAGRGIVHGDLKPANIIVTKTGIKLLDFGVASERLGNSDRHLLGTPTYLAPEVIRSEPFDQRADLYALGILLFRFFAGRPPFEADDSENLLLLHLHEPPPDVRTFNPTVPDKMAALISALLVKNPKQRLYHPRQVVEALSEISGETYAMSTDETRTARINTTNFIGREYEIDAIKQAVAARLSQNPKGASLIMLAGETGMGKTRLLQEARQHVLLEDISAVAVSAHQCSGPLGLVQWLYRQVDDAPSESMAFQIGEHLLQRLAESLEKIKARSPRGLAIFIDDLDEASREDLEILAYVARGLQQMNPGLPVLLITAVKTEGGAQTPDALQNAPLLLIRLSALTADEIRRWLKAHDVAQPVVEILAPRLHRLTAGNPLLFREILKELQLQPVWNHNLTMSAAEWDNALEALAPPRSVRETFSHILQSLGAREREVAEAFAVLDEGLETAALNAVVDNAGEALASLRWRGLLQSTWHQERLEYRLAHPLMGYLLLENIAPERKRALHSRLVAYLRTTSTDQTTARLARHVLQMGVSMDAFQTAVSAGDAAAISGARHEAVYFYEAALEMTRQLKAVSREQKENLYRYLSQLYRYLGRMPDALKMVAQARDLSPNDANLWPLEWARRQGEILQVMGNPQQALETFDAALAGINATTLGTAAEEYFAIQWLKTRALYALGRYDEILALTQAALAHPALQSDAPHVARAHLQVNRGLALFYQGQYDAALKNFAQALAQFEALGRKAEATFALNGQGMVYFRQGNTAAALDQFKKAYAVAKAVLDLRLMVNFAMNLGTIYHEQKDYDLALDYYQEALALARRIEHRGEQAKVLNNLANLRVEFCDFKRAEREALESLDLALKIDLPEVQLYNRLVLGAIALELHEPAKALAFFTQAAQAAQHLGYLEKQIHALQGLSQAQGALKNFPAAQAALDEAETLLQRLDSKIRKVDQVIARAHLAQFQNDQATASREYQRAAALADEMVDVGRLWRIRLEQAQLTAKTGNRHEAERLQHEAKALFEECCSRIPADLQHCLRNSAAGRNLAEG